MSISSQEQEMIRELADGDGSFRDIVEQIHMRELRHSFESYRKTTEFAFLSETFNPCPDLLLRSRARARILGREHL